MDNHSKQQILYLLIFLFIKALHSYSKQKETNSDEKKENEALEFNNLGIQNMKLKCYQKAIENFNKAVILNPINLYYSNRACAYADAKIYDKALDDYNYLLNNNKEKSYYFGRAVVLYQMEKYELAKIDFEKSSELGFNLAKEYLRRFYEARPAWFFEEEPINHNVFMNEIKTRYYNRLLYSKNQKCSHCQIFDYSNNSHYNLFLN